MILSPLFTLYDFAHACQEYVSGKFTQKYLSLVYSFSSQSNITDKNVLLK